MQLIICEKPSVGMTIASALGIETKKDGYMESEDFLVSWCIGHLAELSAPSCYGKCYEKWSLEALPILPKTWQLTISKDKEKQFSVLKALLFRNDVTEVINACDAGREGELIFRFVMEKTGCKKPVKRLWISSMEESAIRKGFENLKDGTDYDRLYRSALCRAKADWLVGINATRLFSLLYNHTLNVGRVQSPTLKILADRSDAITNFKKEKHYHVHLVLDGTEAVSDRFSSKEAAEKIATSCKGKTAVCTSITSEKKEALPCGKKQVFISLDPFCPPKTQTVLENDIEALSALGFTQWVVNNPAHIALLKNKNVRIIGGPYLYTFNRWAVSWLENQNIGAFVMPYENSRKNLLATFSPSVRSRILVPVFAYPALFRLRFKLPPSYDFTYFTDKEGASFKVNSTPDGSFVMPETAFSVTDKCDLLYGDGIKRILLDFSKTKVTKPELREVMNSLIKKIPLRGAYRFNWKEGFYSPKRVEEQKSRGAEARSRTKKK